MGGSIHGKGDGCKVVLPDKLENITQNVIKKYRFCSFSR